jgi:formylglycine-generating enzyme required for sulfatase activity
MRFLYLFIIYCIVILPAASHADDQDSALSFPSQYRFTVILPAKSPGPAGDAGTERIIVPEGDFIIRQPQEVLSPEGTREAKVGPAPTAVRGDNLSLTDDDAVMVFVPAGESIIGLPDGRPGSERNPLKTVLLGEFLIDKYEVTNARYRRCVADGGCTIPSLIADYPPAFHEEGKDWYKDTSRDDYPVVGLIWKQAGEYCRWAGKRLPTAAEWEKAARGADGRLYPWGNTWSGTFANWDDEGQVDGFKKIAPVGRFPQGASPFGAEDMSGNVREWVDDLVLKGGSWYSNPESLRAGDPGHEYIVERDDDMGFRCIKDVAH